MHSVFKRMIFLFLILVYPLAVLLQTGSAQPPDPEGFSTINVRLSSKAIHPPEELITQTLSIPDIAIAKPIVGPPSKSAILEDDQRHRMVILTSEDNGELTAYVLDNIDLTPYLRDLHTRVMHRGCETDRMTITGGLGCVALCLKDMIETEILSQ